MFLFPLILLKVRFGPVKSSGAVTGTTQSGSMMAAVVCTTATNPHVLYPPSNQMTIDSAKHQLSGKRTLASMVRISFKIRPIFFSVVWYGNSMYSRKQPTCTKFELKREYNGPFTDSLKHLSQNLKSGTFVYLMAINASTTR